MELYKRIVTLPRWTKYAEMSDEEFVLLRRKTFAQTRELDYDVAREYAYYGHIDEGDYSMDIEFDSLSDYLEKLSAHHGIDRCFYYDTSNFGEEIDFDQLTIAIGLICFLKDFPDWDVYHVKWEQFEVPRCGDYIWAHLSDLMRVKVGQFWVENINSFSPLRREWHKDEYGHLVEAEKITTRQKEDRKEWIEDYKYRVKLLKHKLQSAPPEAPKQTAHSSNVDHIGSAAPGPIAQKRLWFRTDKYTTEEFEEAVGEEIRLARSKRDACRRLQTLETLKYINLSQYSSDDKRAEVINNFQERFRFTGDDFQKARAPQKSVGKRRKVSE